jgi:hypothetical protein
MGSNRNKTILGNLKQKLQILQVLCTIVAIKRQMCYNGIEIIGYADTGWKYMIKILIVEMSGRSATLR